MRWKVTIHSSTTPNNIPRLTSIPPGITTPDSITISTTIPPGTTTHASTKITTAEIDTPATTSTLTSTFTILPFTLR